MSVLLEQLEYGFDRDSRRTWRRRALTTGQDDAYGYDGLSQVVNAARGNLNLNATAIGGVPAGDESWDYDPTGNWRGYRVEENGAVTLDQRRVHDKGNRLTQVEGSPGPVLVDRAGRMTQLQPEGQKLAWDAWSRLVSVANDTDGVIGRYSYDGLSRRMTRVVYAVTWHTYYSDAWRPLEERQDDETTAARQYYWGARHRDDLVRRDRATTLGGSLDETRYVLMDYFSPAAITDENGAVTERYAFSVFGARTILAPDFSFRTTSECEWEFGFQGQFLDSESGFYDYGYRYYSPSLGRWLSKDPIEEDGGVNLYAFADNNGVNQVDLLGLVPSWLKGNKKPTTSKANAAIPMDEIQSGCQPAIECCCITQIILNFTETIEIPKYEIHGVWNHPSGRTFVGTVTVTCANGESWTGYVQTGGMRVQGCSINGPSETNPIGDDSATPAGDTTIMTTHPGKGFPLDIPGARGSITMHPSNYDGSHGCPSLNNQCQFDQLEKMMNYSRTKCGKNSVPIRVQYPNTKPVGNRGHGRSDPPLIPKAIPVPRRK